MAVRTRSELRRIDQAQTVHDKRSFGIAIFTIVVLFFGLVTFMNPIFMKTTVGIYIYHSSAILLRSTLLRPFSIERLNSLKSIEKHSKRNETSNMLQKKKKK